MTFPLPTGICRKVCRPARPRPRVTRTPDVVRMALAAVKHGALPCDIAREVRKAVNCKVCSDQIAEIIVYLEEFDLLAAGWQLLWEQIKKELFELELEPELNIILRVLRMIWRRLTAVIRLAKLIMLMFDAMELNDRLSRVLGNLRVAARKLIDCLREES